MERQRKLQPAPNEVVAFTTWSVFSICSEVSNRDGKGIVEVSNTLGWKQWKDSPAYFSNSMKNPTWICHFTMNLKEQVQSLWSIVFIRFGPCMPSSWLFFLSCMRVVSQSGFLSDTSIALDGCVDLYNTPHLKTRLLVFDFWDPLQTRGLPCSRPATRRSRHNLIHPLHRLVKIDEDIVFGVVGSWLEKNKAPYIGKPAHQYSQKYWSKGGQCWRISQVIYNMTWEHQFSFPVWW